jgi:hypothetical protein
MTAKEARAARLPALEVPLSDAEVDALLDYVMTKVMGRGPVTAAVCQDYYGPGLLICRY